MGLLGISKKGKWIIGGVCAFAVVATATTGLAAWVIGQNTGTTGNGNINIEKNITDTSVSLKVTSSEDDLTVKFGPKAIPEGGEAYKVVNPSVLTVSEEKLDFTISGTYEKKSASASITAVAAELKLSTEAAKLVTDGYIVTPVIANSDGKYILADMTATPDAGENVLTGTFTGTYSFSWGSKFGGMNPCEYFDGTTEGDVKKDYDAAKTALTALSALTSSYTFTVELTIK